MVVAAAVVEVSIAVLLPEVVETDVLVVDTKSEVAEVGVVYMKR